MQSLAQYIFHKCWFSLLSSCSLHLGACELILTYLFHHVIFNPKWTELFLLYCFYGKMFKYQKNISSLHISHSHIDNKGAVYITLHSYFKMLFTQGRWRRKVKGVLSNGGQREGSSRAVSTWIVIFIFVLDLDLRVLQGWPLYIGN